MSTIIFKANKSLPLKEVVDICMDLAKEKVHSHINSFITLQDNINLYKRTGYWLFEPIPI